MLLPAPSRDSLNRASQVPWAEQTRLLLQERGNKFELRNVFSLVFRSWRQAQSSPWQVLFIAKPEPEAAPQRTQAEQGGRSLPACRPESVQQMMFYSLLCRAGGVNPTYPWLVWFISCKVSLCLFNDLIHSMSDAVFSTSILQIIML